MYLLLIELILSLVQLIVLAGLSYYYLLLIASLFPRRPRRSGTTAHKSFAVAIPAHNEAAVIGETVARLQGQDYPSERFDVYVAADHCTDQTALVAREQGALVLERKGGAWGRKAYALQWLLEQILQRETPYDAVVVFDADSQVDPGFLSAMNQALGPAEPVLQGKHVIANPAANRFSGLADVDMRLNNLLRNRAKQCLGLSGRLMGDAMGFDSDVIRQHGWPADSLGEDREYGLYLLTQGIPVRYTPEAVSCGQAAPSWRTASQQRLRWYGGFLQIQKRFAWPLLRQGLRRRDWAALDQAVELLLPPISVLAAFSLAVAVVQGLWPSLGPLLPFPASAAMALAWIAFPFLGLAIDRAPGAAFRSLFYAPFYLIWRLWIGLWARIRGRGVRWIRTRRQEEVDPQPSKGQSP